MTNTELYVERIRDSAIHHWALLDAALDPYAKVTLLALVALRDKNDLCAPGLAKLSVTLGMSESATTRAVNRRCEVGYLERVGTPQAVGRGYKQTFRLDVPPRTK